MRRANSSVPYQNLRLLRNYLHGDLECAGLPTTAVMGVTNRCNLSCPMCLRSVMEFPGPELGFDFFRIVIDQGAPFFRYISLDGPGEPMLNPDIHRIVEYGRGAGIRVVYSTNATMLSPENIDAILSSGLDHIIFSVNGATREVFEKYNRGASYEHVVSGIQRFLHTKISRRSRILVTIQMVRLPETIRQARRFQTIWRVPGVDSVRIKADVVRTEAAQAGTRRKAKTPVNRCPRLWNGPLYVNYDGEVNGCPGVLFRAKALGNAREQSLNELWNGKRMQEMRKAHVDRDFSAAPECLTCAYPRPRLPLILGSFIVNPFLVGRLIPVFEKLALFQRLPLYERCD